MLDQERCILCSRCVRFSTRSRRPASWASSTAATTASSDASPGKTLDNPYSANVVDICPVGALTNRDFRFRARVWYLDARRRSARAAPPAATSTLYHREGRIFRLMPRVNPDVNQYWMCDDGRMTAYGLQGEGRLLRPLARAAEIVRARRLERTRWRRSPSGCRPRRAAMVPGRWGSSCRRRRRTRRSTCCERSRDTLGATIAGVSWSPPDAYHDDLLIKADKNPNTRGLALQGVTTERSTLDGVLAAAEAGSLQALVLCRTDLTSWCNAETARAALERVPYLVVLDTDRHEVVEYASVVLPIATHAETDGTFTNYADRVQRFHQAIDLPGEVRAGWKVLGELAAWLTGQPAARDAEGVFAALAARSDAFRGLSAAQLGGSGSPASTPA